MCTYTREKENARKKGGEEGKEGVRKEERKEEKREGHFFRGLSPLWKCSKLSNEGTELLIWVSGRLPGSCLFF